jgi:hypothetical protein
VATEHPYTHPGPERRLFARTINFFDDYLRGTVGDPDDEDYTATVFNDHPGRTAAEVIQALCDAADEYERTHPTGGGRP